MKNYPECDNGVVKVLTNTTQMCWHWRQRSLSCWRKGLFAFCYFYFLFLSFQSKQKSVLPYLCFFVLSCFVCLFIFLKWVICDFLLCNRNLRWWADIIFCSPVEAMAGPVSLELDPIFLKGLSYLHSKSKDSAEKLKALLDESLSRGSDSSYRSLQKVRSSLFMLTQALFIIYPLIISFFLYFNLYGISTTKY